MQSFPQKPNSAARLHKTPSFSTSLRSYRGDIFTWKILYKPQKIVSYDWQYKGQMLGTDTLGLFICDFLAQMW